MATVKYHINANTGRPNQCYASVRSCPVGGDHFDTKEEARAGYEKQMDAATTALRSVQKEVGEKRAAKAAGTLDPTPAEIEAAHAFEMVNRETGEVESVTSFSEGERDMPGYRASVAKGYVGSKWYIKAIPHGVETADAKEIALQDEVREAKNNPGLSHYGFPEDEMTRHFAGQLVKKAEDKLDTYRLNKALMEGKTSIVGSRGQEYTTMDAGDDLVALQQEMYGMPVGTPVGPTHRRASVTKINGDGTVEITDRDGRVATLHEYVKPLAGGKILKDVPEGKTTLANAIEGKVQAKRSDTEDWALSHVNRTVYFPGVARMTNAKKLEAARVLWEYSGKDVGNFDAAPEATRLAWADSRLNSVGEVDFDRTNRTITANGVGFVSTGERESMKIVDL